jgi:hypothetical protein
MGSLLSFAFGLLRGVLPLVGGVFTGGLSWAWSALAAFLGTDIGSKIAIGAGCVIAGFAWGFSHEHAVKTREVAAARIAAGDARDAYWSKKLGDANASVELRVLSAVAAAKAVPSAAPLTDDELLQRCAASKACRDQGAARRRVQSNSVPNVGARRHPAEHNGN